MEPKLLKYHISFPRSYPKSPHLPFAVSAPLSSQFLKISFFSHTYQNINLQPFANLLEITTHILRSPMFSQNHKVKNLVSAKTYTSSIRSV